MRLILILIAFAAAAETKETMDARCQVACRRGEWQDGYYKPSTRTCVCFDEMDFDYITKVPSALAIKTDKDGKLL